MDIKTSKTFRRNKTLLKEQVSNTTPNPYQPVYARCDASIFLESARYFYNPMKVHLENEPYVSHFKTQNFLHKQNLDSLRL